MIDKDRTMDNVRKRNNYTKPELAYTVLWLLLTGAVNALISANGCNNQTSAISITPMITSASFSQTQLSKLVISNGPRVFRLQ
jgi:hypothetical protein